ncbi:MAG: DoxX family protein [Burkholderiales bacterium]
MTTPSTNDSTAAAATLLRITLGVMFLAHGLLKFVVFTLPGTAGFFESVGLPGWAAYVVAPAEVLAGIALVAGFHVRAVALATLPILIGALYTHAGSGWLFTNKNGGWEYPAFLVIVAIAVALLGEGRLAVSGSRARVARSALA